MSKDLDPNVMIFDANQYPLDNGVRLIEASAGTGKTFSLAHLVIRLLTEREISIKEILVVSFTKATAAEIKAIISKRILTVLKALENWKIESSGNEFDLVLSEWLDSKILDNKIRIHWSNLLLESLENIDTADITTIHGFCYRTIKREAIQIGSTILPTIEEDNHQLVRDIANEYWKEQILELNPNHIKGIEKAGFKIDSLIANIIKIDNDPTIRFEINDPKIDTSFSLVSQFDKVLRAYWFEFNQHWLCNGDNYEYYLRDISQKMRDQGITNTKPYSPRPKKDRSEIISNWINSFESIKDHNEKRSVPFYIDIRDQKTLIEDYYHPKNLSELKKKHKIKTLVIFNKEFLDSIVQIWDGPVEIVWKHSLSWCLHAIAKRRSENGVLTNGDLLKALDPQKNDKGENSTKISSKIALFKKLRERYKVALIDEFQDTDPVQWRFLKHSFGNSAEHLLLMIGDPKQSIYRFRGGDLNTYLQARSEVERIDFLDKNYRTTPTLMDGLNQLMHNGLRRSKLKINSLKPCSKEKSLLLNSNEHPLQLITMENNSSQTNSDESKLTTKSKLEELIPNIVSIYILELLNKASKKVNPKDICILVNNHNQAEKIRSSLSKAGLPSNSISKGDILKREAALILQKFINCLANPGNSNNLRLLACSALIQWSPNELKEAESNGDFDKLACDILAWSQKLEHLGLSACLSELLEVETIAELSLRDRILNDLQQCSQIVQEEMYRQGFDAKGAAKWLARERLSPDRQVPEERHPNSDVDENSISVITIHKSKGLQYEVVICPYLWQAPPPQKGPLWKVSSSQHWQLFHKEGIQSAINIEDTSHKESLEEYERLAYVALTRARKQLVLIWGQSAKQEGNPLANFLFNPKDNFSDMKLLTNERLTEWLISNDIPITIKSFTSNKSLNYWNQKMPPNDLVLGAKPNRKLDKSWGRYSYSSWTTAQQFKNENLIELEKLTTSNEYNFKETKEQHKVNSTSFKKSLSLKNEWTEESPLSIFPRGAFAGDCLHKILEKLDFQRSVTCNKTTKLIEEELSRFNMDISLLGSVQETLNQLLNVPLRKELSGLKFKEIIDQNRLHELRFDLPLSPQGLPVNSLNLSEAFKNDPNQKFGGSYAQKIADLKIHSRGFLTGSIDLVFADNKEHSKARWWVADWKSNWIEAEEQNISCGPHHYNNDAMEKEMICHHYPLQAHLYLVALHRFLQWRLPNYSPEDHLGGYIYVFLRGIPGETLIKRNANNANIPGLFIEKAPVSRITELNEILERGKS